MLNLECNDTLVAIMTYISFIVEKKNGRRGKTVRSNGKWVDQPIWSLKLLLL